MRNGSRGGRGLRKHRSHAVVEIDRCLIAHPDAIDAGGSPSTVVEPVVAAHRSHDFAVASDGFWQPHVAAPQVLVDCVLDFLRPQPG